VLASECAPNHVRSLVMAAALMTQWLFNFVSAWYELIVSTLLILDQVIAKITPLMLADITYGTFLLFGSCCIVMGVYVIFCVPETKNVPLESIYLLFEGDIIKGCIKDTIPRYTRAKQLQNHHVTNDEDDMDTHKAGRKGAVEHVEDA
jgi:SP family sugar:H+ symporter-like MFS transporter